MELRKQLQQNPLVDRVDANAISQLFHAAYADVATSLDAATRLDRISAIAHMAVRSIRKRGGQFVSPASITDGGLVRPVSGLVTLPELRRNDAIHAADGSLRAGVEIDHYVGSLLIDGEPLALFDDDSATGWSVTLDTPIKPELSFPETGEITGAHFSIRVDLDLPQMVSQIEIGTIGSPVLLFRIENSETDAVLWSGKRWIDPGTLLYLNEPALVQSLRLHFVQMHAMPLADGYRYRTVLTSLAALHVEYAEQSFVALPPMAVERSLLRPFLDAEGTAELQIQLGGTWRSLGAALSLVDVRRTDSLPVYGGGVFLQETPELIESVLIRQPTGQSIILAVGDLRSAGNLLYLPGMADGSLAVVVYTHRPRELSARLHLQRGASEHISSTVKEVRLL